MHSSAGLRLEPRPRCVCQRDGVPWSAARGWDRFHPRAVQQLPGLPRCVSLGEAPEDSPMERAAQESCLYASAFSALSCAPLLLGCSAHPAAEGSLQGLSGGICRPKPSGLAVSVLEIVPGNYHP